MNFPRYTKHLFFIYLSGLIFFSVFRLVLLFTNISQVTPIPGSIILRALVMGWRFDTVISAYILCLPFLVLSFSAYLKRNTAYIYKYIDIYIYILYLICFFICAADIPYYFQFGTRLTAGILNWTDSPSMMAGFVLQDMRYYPYLALFISVSWLFYYSLKKIHAMVLAMPETNFTITKLVLLQVLLALALFLGMRGRISRKAPISWGTAFFSNYGFANQLGLNPVYTFIQSAIQDNDNKKIDLIDENIALKNVKRFLGVTSPLPYTSPIARKVNASGELKKYNIVLVIMESMGAVKMGRYGNKDRLSPTLDSLAQKGIVFNNIYTAGMHTFNGIYSTLYGMPALLGKNPMQPSDETMQPFTGFPYVLKQNGYRNIFFTTHDEQFDNMEGFLMSNHFDSVIGQKHYPSAEVLSATGVPDDYMFEYSIPVLNKLYENNRPFFAAYMTGSNHGPYILPNRKDFVCKETDKKKRAVAFADWSIAQFLKQASSQKWFNNTIFIFTADHGDWVEYNTELPISYHHTPIIYYAPKLLSHREYNDIGGQIDVFPTTMQLLNIQLINNTMGVNLFRNKRSYIYFSSDNDVGCLNDSLYWFKLASGVEYLYDYRKTGNYLNILNKHKNMVDSMKTYTYSMIQATQYILSNKLAGPQDGNKK